MTESFWVSRFNPAPFDASMRIVAHVEPGTSILDVGCNTGELGEQLRTRLGCHVVGVEILAGAAEIAENRLDEVICTDVASLPEIYPPCQQFDFVVAADVLEHTQDPRHNVRLLVDYLKPHGKMIVSLPNVANWAVRFSLLMGRFDDDSHYSILSGDHLHHFTLPSAKALLQQAGLVIEDVDVTHGLFVFRPYHVTIERILGRWRWYRHLEYLVTKAWKTMFAYQFILVARRQDGED